MVNLIKWAQFVSKALQSVQETIKQKGYIVQFSPSLQFHIINVLVNITNLHVMQK